MTYHTTRENKRLCNNIKSRTRFNSLSLLLAVVFATSLFLLPRLSVVYAATNNAISYDPATSTVTIQGDCTTAEIYAFMHGQGAGANATEVHFANSLTIQTLQTDSSKAPFADVASLERVTSASNTTVSFEGNNGADPTLMYFFNSATYTS